MKNREPVRLLLSGPTREILSRVEPAVRPGNRGWVFRDASYPSRRYDLLGFSRAAHLWASLDSDRLLDARAGLSARVPAGHYGEHVTVDVQDLKSGLAALLDGLVRCGAGCIVHEDCRESLLRGAPLGTTSLAVACARSQIRWLAEQADWRARRIKSVPRVREERQLRKAIHQHQRRSDAAQVLSAGHADAPLDEHELQLAWQAAMTWAKGGPSPLEPG